MNTNQASSNEAQFFELYPSMQRHRAFQSDGGVLLDDPRDRLTDYSSSGVREWIIRICGKYGLTPTELSRLAELAPSTLNRFLKGGGSSSNISASTIEAIMLTLNIIRHEIVAEKQDEEPDNYKHNRPANLISVPVIGIIDRNNPSLLVEIAVNDQFNITVPLRVSILGLGVTGFVVNDLDNTRFLNGSIVLGIPMLLKDALGRQNKTFIVHRTEPNRGVKAFTADIITDPRGMSWLLPTYEEANAIFLGDEKHFQEADLLQPVFDVVGFFQHV